MRRDAGNQKRCMENELRLSCTPVAVGDVVPSKKIAAGRNYDIGVEFRVIRHQDSAALSLVRGATCRVRCVPKPDSRSLSTAVLVGGAQLHSDSVTYSSCRGQ